MFDNDIEIGYIDGTAVVIHYPTAENFTTNESFVDELIAAIKEQGTFEPQDENEDDLEV